MSSARATHTQAAPPPVMPGRFGPPGHGIGEKAPPAKDPKATLGRLWNYLRKQKLSLVLASLIVIATSALNLLGPYLMGRAVDTYTQSGLSQALTPICLAMLGAYLTSSLLTWAQSRIMLDVAQRTVRDIREDLFESLVKLPLSYFDSRQHGDVMSRLTNDVDNVNQVLSDGVTSIVAGVFGLVGAALVMFLLNAPLATLTVLGISGLSLGLNRWLSTKTRSGFRAQQASLGDLNGYIQETVSAQRVVKAYGQEKAAIGKFAEANEHFRRNATQAQIFSSFMGPFMNGINNLGLVMVAGVGGLLAVNGRASVGTIASFINYTRQFGRPLNDIANLYNSIQSAIAGAERVFQVMDESPETDSPDALTLPAVRGEVVFENVCFSYKPGVPVLRNVSLTARPGQTIALIGPTGAGKTTVINLLTRFYEIDSGRITLDGQDIRGLRKDDLRRQLGIVLQDSFLFARSVRENIRFGRPEATDAEVERAATLANAHGFIQHLPNGYDTVLSERGGNLSHGQRQMLSIARAILADPGILILDEATSSVDTRTEKQIQTAMQRLMEGRTSFVIAHRLSTIRAADQILYINQGEVVERGTHEELMAERGFYYRLNTQPSGDADDIDSAD